MTKIPWTEKHTETANVLRDISRKSSLCDADRDCLRLIADRVDNLVYLQQRDILLDAFQGAYRHILEVEKTMESAIELCKEIE
jgi:hypothetical protein